MRSLEHCAMVLTTTHREHLRELTGTGVEAIELIGKPYDLQAIVDAVERTIDGNTERVEYKEGNVYVVPGGMSSTKNVGKSEVTIYTVTLKPE